MLEENLDEMVVEEGADEEIVAEESEDEAEHESEAEAEDEGEEEHVITVDGESPPDQEEEQTKQAPAWVRDVRKQNRSLKDENRKLKAELERASVSAPQVSELPPKPTLEEFDYDSEDYEKALDDWYSKQRKHEESKAEQSKALEAQQKQWQSVVDSYNNAKQSLKVRDYDVAEEMVTDNLTIEQQAIILQGADNPAAVVYVLGRNKGQVEELSKITDPVKFAFAIAKLEGKMKVEKRKAPPPPEKAVKGSASASAVDNTLDRLREEAMRTGDTSKLMAYKRSLKKK